VYVYPQRIITGSLQVSAELDDVASQSNFDSTMKLESVSVDEYFLCDRSGLAQVASGLAASEVAIRDLWDPQWLAEPSQTPERAISSNHVVTAPMGTCSNAD
jgi:hypothetical protein